MTAANEHVECKIDSAQWTVFPILHQDIWNAYKQQLACFWKAEEIDFSQDYDDYSTLGENEQHFLKRVLAFFAFADGLVNFNLEERFIKEVTYKEAKIAYDFQKMMENIHGEVYSKMLQNIVKDPEEQSQLFQAVRDVPSLRGIARWCMKWVDSDTSMATRLFAFAIVEGVFFSSAFACIFWFKKIQNHGRLLLPGLIKSNEFIARDEGMHTEFACLLYNNYFAQERLRHTEAVEMIEDAFEMICAFVDDTLPYQMVGMDRESMRSYVRYTSDRLLRMLHYDAHFGDANPFPFMDSIGLYGKTNFFEMRPTEYQDAHVLNASRTQAFTLCDEF